jgi:cyclic pyranopterin phosphate synthase
MAAAPDGHGGERLVDGFDRVHTDLRLSVTDRCNLRCSYCMPAEGLDWLSRDTLLTDDEIHRLARIAVARLGIRSIRITGGEPLVRRGLPELIGRLSGISPSLELSLTTNGVGLARLARTLHAAGLQRVNVSLDTLRPDRFLQITRRDHLHHVLAGLAAARDAGLNPVKINAVLVRGVNDDEILDLVSFAVDGGYRLRFIESMPLDAQGAWDRDRMVAAEEILTCLRAQMALEPVRRSEEDSAPAEEWRIPGSNAVVGVIASVTQPFCGSCNRLRLTADGQLRTCLFATKESDLRGLLRGGADDDEIVAAWQSAVAAKGRGHAIGTADFRRPARPMSAIGG